MEEKTKEEGVEEKSTEILKGRTGEELKPEKVESPLEEVRRLNRETKEMYVKMDETVERFAKLNAEAAIAGKSFAGQTLPEEEDPKKKSFKEGGEMAEKFLGIPK